MRSKLYLPQAVAKKKSSQVKVNVKLSNERITGELDLRGMYGDEAIPVIDRYLAVAAEQRYPSVNIIHGKGTGALRVKVREFLLRHPLVKEMYDGGPTKTITAALS